MIIGDLAFLYDMNSISIRGIKNNVDVVIKNNRRDLKELTELIKDMHDIVKNRVRRDKTL